MRGHWGSSLYIGLLPRRQSDKLLAAICASFRLARVNAHGGTVGACDDVSTRSPKPDALPAWYSSGNILEGTPPLGVSERCDPRTARSTSFGALLFRAVVRQLVVVLFCALVLARALSSHEHQNWSRLRSVAVLLSLSCGNWMVAARRQAP